MVRPFPSRRAALALLAGASLLVACGGDGAGDPTAAPSPAAPSPAPSPSPTASPSPTQTEVDVTAVPEDIDVAYVQAVMDELNRRETDAYREVVASGEIGESFYAAIKSLHSPADADRQIGGFEEFIGVDGLADPPQPITSDVERILVAGPECIEAEVVHDIRPLLSDDIEIEPEQPHTLKLVRTEPSELNPTAWAIDYLSWFELEERCDA